VASRWFGLAFRCASAMGRGGGGKGGRGGGGGDKTGAYFAAIEGNNQKSCDTVRWSLVHGGIMLHTSNEAGQTGLMLAAATGKDKALDTILEQVRRMRSREDKAEALNAKDEEGKTPLMLAAAGGRLECVKLLMEAGASIMVRDEEGYTARIWADWAGKQDIVDCLDGKDPDEGVDDAGAESEGGFEGETDAQRRKRKKAEHGDCATSKNAKQDAKRKAQAEQAAQTATKDAPLDNSPAVLPEIIDALKAIAEQQKTNDTRLELKINLVRKEENQVPGLVRGEIDPALWRCGANVRSLEIRWRPRLDDGSLDRISALKRVLNLVVQDSGLVALPESLSELAELRSLDLDGNCLFTFPRSMKKLAGSLVTVSAARNKLTSGCLDRLSPLDHLTSLKLDGNLLDSLEDLDLNKKLHLSTLSVAQNQITELPEDCWGDLAMLAHLNVSNNKLTELPCEMGDMKEKKLTELLLDENPWKDGKIRNMIENSSVLSNTVLPYLRKMKGKGNKKPKAKGKKKAKADSESEEEAPAKAESEDEPPPPEPEPEKKKEKKSKKKKDKVVDDEDEAPEPEVEEEAEPPKKEKKKKKSKDKPVEEEEAAEVEEEEAEPPKKEKKKKKSKDKPADEEDAAEAEPAEAEVEAPEPAKKKKSKKKSIPEEEA